MSDLIKRSDAIEQLNEAISICPPCMKGTGIYRTSALEEAIDIINQIPTADRPRGEWIEQEDCWQCSECGDEYVLEVDVKPIDAKMHYCPNCGARMKGADDETDND